MLDFSKRRIRLIVIFMIAGMMFGCGLATLRSQGIFERWAALDGPPGGGVEILDSTGTAVYVRAADDNTYVCTVNLASSCWQETEWPIIITRGERAIVEESQFWVVFPPVGESFDKLIVVYNPGDELFAEAHYVLLEDGNLWVWRHDKYWLWAFWNFDIYIVYIPVGLFIGLVGGFFIAVITIKPPKRAPSIRRVYDE